jgi:hypothetical protein
MYPVDVPDQFPRRSVTPGAAGVAVIVGDGVAAGVTGVVVGAGEVQPATSTIPARSRIKGIHFIAGNIIQWQ